MNNNVDPKRSAIHEASHAVVTKLFEENLHLRFLTISKEKISEVAAGDATIYGTIGVVPKDNIGVSVGVVSLAGMIGEEIWKKGATNIQANKAAILSDPNVLDRQLGGHDFELFRENSSVYAWKYRSHEEYEHLCLNFLLDFLCNEQVWPVVERLSQEVLKKDNLTLDEPELETVFLTSGYNDFLNNNKETLLKTFEQTIDQDSPEYQLKKIMAVKNFDIFSSEDQKKPCDGP